jgi:hypothetical protein
MKTYNITTPPSLKNRRQSLQRVNVSANTNSLPEQRMPVHLFSDLLGPATGYPVAHYTFTDKDGTRKFTKFKIYRLEGAPSNQGLVWGAAIPCEHPQFEARTHSRSGQPDEIGPERCTECGELRH